MVKYQQKDISPFFSLLRYQKKVKCVILSKDFRVNKNRIYTKEVKTMNTYLDYILEQAKTILAIDSPTGFTKNVTNYIKDEYTKMGYQPVITEKGGVLVHLGGQGNGLLMDGHVDTLGGMVAEIKGNGALRISPVGGLNPNNVETENCRIYTYDNRCYTGTAQLCDASLHVNGKYNDTLRNFDNIEILLDEKVFSKQETKDLGIMNGNFVCFDTRTTITSSGYIKSRYLDDKLSTAIMMGYAKYLKDEQIALSRSVYQHITVYEEVGHGGCASVPEGTTEILSVDMGCIGNGLECKEHQVSICVKDSRGPFNYDMVTGLIRTAQEHQIDFATDIYPHYGSDADAAMGAGHDLRHALIGPGIYASHGYERSHVDGVYNTFFLLKHYIK